MKCRLWPGVWVLVLVLFSFQSMLFAQETANIEEDALSEGVEQVDADTLEAQTSSSTKQLVDGLDGAVVLGPGGKPLRTDYPGTQASLQSRMLASGVDGADLNEQLSRPEDVYDMRVRELETRVDDLKEKVFRSKSRIVLLKETILTGNLAGSRAVIQYENKLGGSYKLRRALLSLDGTRILNRVDRNNELSKEKNLEVYNASITPGMHTVSVMLSFQGSGFGLFSYVDAYEFSIRSSCQFVAEEGKTTVVKVISYAKGNIFTAHEERPDVLCEVRLMDLAATELGEATR